LPEIVQPLTTESVVTEQVESQLQNSMTPEMKIG
jgi:hypothetical protein